MTKDTDLELRIAPDGSYFVRCYNTQFTINLDEDYAVFMAYLDNDAELWPTPVEIQMPINDARYVITAALTALGHFGLSPHRDMVFEPSRAYVVYIDSEGEEYKQPISDINEADILIDPETGDDLDIIRVEAH